MNNKLSVLGGSSPFTAALVDGIEARGDALSPHLLVLAGRNASHLELMAIYAHNRLSRLGWKIEWTTDNRTAVRGANIVLHQIRYGGSDGRQLDEELALAFDLFPDETLGPGAIQSALRLSHSLDETCRDLVQECPRAWVLNLTNPLSVTTARMIQAGVRCIGLCELPRITAQQAASLLGQSLEQMQWSYAGLNHRGFIVGLSLRGVDRITDLASHLGSETFSGVSADEIRALGAIPTKYFSLLQKGTVAPQGGRAAFLESLRQRIFQEIIADPQRSPPSLKERYLAWYPHSVIPVMEALSSRRPRLLEVNSLTENGLVEEGRAFVSEAGIGPLVPVQVSPPVGRWIELFRKHERYVLDAVEHPCFDAIRLALGSDPLITQSKVEDCARLIWNRFEKQKSCRM